MPHLPTTVATIVAVDPSGPGAIAGFEVRCPACGFTFRTSLFTIALADSRDHLAWAIAREARDRKAVAA